jgi:hypothetical protein
LLLGLGMALATLGFLWANSIWYVRWASPAANRIVIWEDGDCLTVDVIPGRFDEVSRANGIGPGLSIARASGDLRLAGTFGFARTGFTLFDIRNL